MKLMILLKYHDTSSFMLTASKKSHSATQACLQNVTNASKCVKKWSWEIEAYAIRWMRPPLKYKKLNYYNDKYIEWRVMTSIYNRTHK